MLNKIPNCLFLYIFENRYKRHYELQGRNTSYKFK